MYQVREPYSTVQYLAERIDIASLLGLPHRSPPDEVDPHPALVRARSRRACALRALGLLLADGASTVGRGKTF